MAGMIGARYVASAGELGRGGRLWHFGIVYRSDGRRVEMVWRCEHHHYQRAQALGCARSEQAARERPWADR